MTDSNVDDALLNEAFGGEGQDVDNLYVGGGSVVNKEGFYHVEVLSVSTEAKDTEESKSKCLRLDLQVVAGTEEDQVHNSIFHRIYFQLKDGSPPSDGQKKGAYRCAHALGLIDDATAESGGPIPWSKAQGHNCVCEVKMEKGTGKYKDSYKIPFNSFWPVGHDDVKEVPKDASILEAAGSNVEDYSELTAGL